MSTLFYCGPPGSGKSYHVVKEVIIPSLKKGRKILTNLPVRLDVLAAKIPELKFVEKMNFLEMIDEERIRNIHEIVADPKGIYAGCLIVIDEAHNYWPTDEPIRNKDFKKWYTEQRHYFQDVVLLTQDFDNVHKFMRSITEKRFEYSKNADKGFENGYNEDYYIGKSKKRPVRTMHSYDKFYFQFYFSHSQSLAGKGLSEKRVGRKVNILFKHVLRLGIGLAIFIGSMSIFFSRMNEKIEAGEKTELENSKKDNSTNQQSSRSNVGVSSPIGSGEFNKVNISLSQGLSGDGFEKVFDWCRNTNRSYAGVGAVTTPGTRFEIDNGHEFYLSGAHEVVGIIGVGSRSLYLLKTLSGELIKGKINGSPYRLGQKVCL
ncbi:MAG: zonular occludens toxin domain-containing protein [Nitrospinota bacterium]